MKKIIISVGPLRYETTDTKAAENFVSFCEGMGFTVTTKIEDATIESPGICPMQ